MYSAAVVSTEHLRIDNKGELIVRRLYTLLFSSSLEVLISASTGPRSIHICDLKCAIYISPACVEIL